MSSDKHFINNFNGEPGLFLVYMALVVNSGDISKPPTEKQEVSYKWLTDETGLPQKKVKACVSFLKIREVLLTEDRVDILYYKFIFATHDEIADKIKALTVTVTKTTEANIIHALSKSYLKYVLEKNKDRSVSVSYCLGKMMSIIADFRRRKLTEKEIEHFFISLAHQVAEGQNLEELLRSANQENIKPLIKHPTKIVGWSC